MTQGTGFAATALMAVVLASPAPAATLSPHDADLGRVSASALTNGLSVTVDVGGDVPLTTHVIARFQNNRPLMRDGEGQWTPWNGSVQALSDSHATLNGSTLVFPILTWLPRDLFYPISVTVAYQTADGVKSGTLVIDAP